MKITSQLPQLKKCEDIFNLIIPTNVEQKIRHLCNKVSTVEWSGTLFYTVKGTYEDKNLEIVCVDLFPMDIGSSAYTEFDMSPDVIAYMTDHPELLDCQIGLIHSHNNMASFFSGTDLSTLQEEGRDRNHFVSLIVNNAGTYTAAITRKLTLKDNVISDYSYKSFNDTIKTGTKSYETTAEIIEYNFLTIIKEEVENPFLELDNRLTTIKEAKNKTPKYSQPLPYKPFSYTEMKENIVSQPTLFDISNDKDAPIDPNDNNYITDSEIKAIVLQLITGSIVIGDNSKIDPVKWVQRMPTLFGNRFKDDESFGMWMWTMVEFILTNAVPEKYEHCQDDYIIDLCSEVYNTLKELPQNKYITIIEDTLLLWMK